MQPCSRIDHSVILAQRWGNSTRDNASEIVEIVAVPEAKTHPFDVAIIGAGVVGCAVARKFTLEGAKVVVIEKEADILSGASKGNSAILHTGFDAPAGSLELKCMQDGYSEYMQIHQSLGLPLVRSGALVVAWSEDELVRLAEIERHAIDNNVGNVARVSRTELARMEPNLSTASLGALHVPDEHLIDPWSAPLAYLRQAMENGAQIRRKTEVLNGEFDGDVWTLATSTEQVRARYLVNCAGLHGDTVDQRLTGEQCFSIKPRKGQFVVFDKIAYDLVTSIILPVPSERTKGIVLARTAFGNLLVGPTAEEQEDRERAAVDHETLLSLVAEAVRMVPRLADAPVTTCYAGLRPATEEKGYRIRHDRTRHLITAGGIRSTGLTAALGIAACLFQHYLEGGESRHVPVSMVAPYRAPQLAEQEVRDWCLPGYGEIVCHCEMVTLREIETALGGPLPAGDFGGLKRRTRAGMGRCQGFYCNARLAKLCAGILESPLAVGEDNV